MNIFFVVFTKFLFFLFPFFFFVSDKDWLKTPDDEIEISNLALRDIILLGEYREWTAVGIPFGFHLSSGLAILFSQMMVHILD